jgi:hypothetical protein
VPRWRRRGRDRGLRPALAWERRRRRRGTALHRVGGDDRVDGLLVGDLAEPVSLRDTAGRRCHTASRGAADDARRRALPCAVASARRLSWARSARQAGDVRVLERRPRQGQAVARLAATSSRARGPPPAETFIPAPRSCLARLPRARPRGAAPASSGCSKSSSSSEIPKRSSRSRFQLLEPLVAELRPRACPPTAVPRENGGREFAVGARERYGLQVGCRRRRRRLRAACAERSVLDRAR